MSQFSRIAGSSPKSASDKDQPASQACSKSDVSQVLKAFSRAAPPLSIRAGIGVILGDDRHSQLLLQPLFEIDITNAGNMRGRLDGARACVSKTGNSNAYASDRRIGLGVSKQEPASAAISSLEIICRRRGTGGFRHGAERVDARQP